MKPLQEVNFLYFQGLGTPLVTLFLFINSLIRQLGSSTKKIGTDTRRYFFLRPFLTKYRASFYIANEVKFSLSYLDNQICFPYNNMKPLDEQQHYINFVLDILLWWGQRRRRRRRRKRRRMTMYKMLIVQVNQEKGEQNKCWVHK